jgi:putative colanic acid biosynthesis acetyltransferase WcaF
MPDIQNLRAFRLSPGARGKPAWIIQLWWIVQSVLFRTSPQFLFGWRRFLLRAFGAQIGARVLIRPSVRVTCPWKLRIGDDVWIGDGVELYTLDCITLGSNVVVSQRSYLCTGTHDYQAPTFDQITAPIVIEPEAWIAADVFIGPGVTIGQGAVAGVRSLVLKNIPKMMIAEGQPAKVVRPRLGAESKARTHFNCELSVADWKDVD